MFLTTKVISVGKKTLGGNTITRNYTNLSSPSLGTKKNEELLNFPEIFPFTEHALTKY